MGLGKDWDGICIVLTGALSRFVNQLPDPEQEDLSGHDATAESKGKGKKTVKSHLDPRTLLRLRKVRANLKLGELGPSDSTVLFGVPTQKSFFLQQSTAPWHWSRHRC